MWGRLAVERMKGKTEKGGPVRRKRNSNPGEAAVFVFFGKKINERRKMKGKAVLCDQFCWLEKKKKMRGMAFSWFREPEKSKPGERLREPKNENQRGAAAGVKDRVFRIRFCCVFFF